MEPTGGAPKNCTDTSDLLPWLINGTLQPEEQDAVVFHLQGCPACRRELDETRNAAAIASFHPDPETLTAFIDESLIAADSATVSLHLTRCAACSEDVRMAREGRARIEAAGNQPAHREVPWWLIGGAAAASGVAAGWLLAAVWFDASVLRSKLQSAELQVRSLQTGYANLEKELAAARGPRLNVMTVDLFPVSMVRRSGGDSSSPSASTERVRLPETSGSIALVLNSQMAPRQGVDIGVRLFDSRNRMVWQASGLIRQRQGEFTVQFPRTFLPSGDYELRLVAGTSEEAVETYRFRN